MEIFRYQHRQERHYSAKRFGFELEVEVKRNHTRQAVADKFDALLDINHPNDDPMFALKEDGSLNYGFEIVSKPLPLGVLKQLLTEVAKKARQTRAVDSWDGGRCGFHLHIGTEHFENAVQLLRFLRCFQSVTIWRKLVVPVAGRNACRWARKVWPESVRRHRDYESSPLANMRVSPKTVFQTPDRYYAVNLTNPHTVEIRIFRGSIQDERLLSYVELIELFLAYAKRPHSSLTCAVELKHMLKKDKTTYVTLRRFLKTHKLFCYSAIQRKPKEQTPCA